MNNTPKQQISVTLPGLLIEELDMLASKLNRSRSEVIAFALKQYFNEKSSIEEQLKNGYLEMGDINLCIAEKSVLSDECAYKIYEEYLESL